MVFAGFLGVKTDRLAFRNSSSGSRPKLKTHRSGSASGGSSSSVTATAAPSGSSSQDAHQSQQQQQQQQDQAALTRSHSNGRHHEYISDESQLRPAPEETPDLRELNASLDALAVVFPDVQIDVFREMLTSFDGESRLALVADALLKNRVVYVKGRWRTVGAADPGGDGGGNKAAKPTATGASAALAGRTQQQQQRDHMGEEAGPGRPSTSSSSAALPIVPARDCFRSPEYKKAVKALAFREFKGLSPSSISAALAETNHSYLEARRILVEMSSKSWRYTIASLFVRRKPSAANNSLAAAAAAAAASASSSSDAAGLASHPLVIWKSIGRGPVVPTVKSTGNAELDRELYDELVAPLRRRAREAQEEKDRVLASVLNMEEAEEAEATHECACCFTAATFEEITTCAGGAKCEDGGEQPHVICFRCVQHSISEAVFGQGWQRSIDKELGTLACPAMGAEECGAHIPSDQMHRAMLGERKGAEMLHRLDQRLAEHSLVSSGLPLVRCPFCSYAEVDDLYLPSGEGELRVRVDSLFNLTFLVLCVGAVPFLLPLMLFSSFVCLLFTSRRTLGDLVAAELRAALARHRRRRRGLKFQCRDPTCGRVSCLSCGKGWADVHVCHESALVALRTQVEQAMSMAIKRVCPRCNTSFVKHHGCNKLTCPCGYKMCYVCRKDIGGGEDGGAEVGYRHFCDHFRPEGDPRPCDQCSRCNLWEIEDTDGVLRAAKEEAERRWLETERRELSGAERAFLETGVASASSSKRGLLRGGRGGVVGLVPALLRGRLPALSEVCDMVVETIFV